MCVRTDSNELIQTGTHASHVEMVALFIELDL